MNEHKGTPDPALPQLTLLVHIPWLGGGRSVELTPEQAKRYETAPQQVVAEVLGVTFEEYLVWLSWQGSAQCDAYTAAGRRCRGTVGGVRFTSPAEMVRFGGGYCSTHGEGSTA
jgi:hypothetical protein